MGLVCDLRVVKIDKQVRDSDFDAGNAFHA